MKLRRLAALELLGALRSLDGLAVNGQFNAFTFTTDAIEKIVDNIVALRAVAAEVQAYHDEQSKLLASGKVMDGCNPNFNRFSELLTARMQEEIEVPLTPLTKDELNVKTNHIPPSVREKLLPLMRVPELPPA